MRRILAILLCSFCLGQVGLAANPVPFVSEPLVPTAVVPGSGAFRLTVNGANFVNGATVDWNGQALPTTYVSGSRLTAAVPATDVAKATTATITVSNPGVGAASNAVFFQVMNPESNVYYEDAPGYPTGAPQLNGQQPASVQSAATGDFANDGGQDLAIGLAGSASGPYALEDFLSNGDGTFAPPQSGTQLPSGTSNLAVGDLTGNGRLDVVANDFDGDAMTNGECTNTVFALLNNGNGAFSMAPGSPVTVGPCPWGIAMGDFNRDGKLDLAVVNHGIAGTAMSGSVSILLGNGDGTFTQAPGSPAITGLYDPPSIVTGDFNGDGKLDLAVSNDSGDVYILLGNGDGTFTQAPGSPVRAGALHPLGLVAGDFNGDGKLDLAEINTGVNPASEISSGSSFGDAVRILLGNGDGTFTVLQGCCGYTDNGTYGYGLVEGDFNGDGKLDLAVDSQETQPFNAASFLQVLLGNGDGTFTSTDYAVYMNLPPDAFSTADFNNDGRPDFFVGSSMGPMWSFVQANRTWAGPPDFTISAQNSSLSVSPGGAVTDNITLASQYGFYGPVTISCSGAPALAACDLLTSSHPAYPTMLLPVESVYPTLTITTTAPPAASSLTVPTGPGSSPNSRPVILWTLCAGLVLCLWLTRRWRKAGYARIFVLAALISLGAFSSCGGQAPVQSQPAPKAPQSTPAGTYNITVTATSPSGGGLTHSTTVKLVVQ